MKSPLTTSAARPGAGDCATESINQTSSAVDAKIWNPGLPPRCRSDTTCNSSSLSPRPGLLAVPKAPSGIVCPRYLGGVRRGLGRRAGRGAGCPAADLAGG